MKTIKVGIIGAGRIGKIHASNIIFSIPQMQVKAIADPLLDQEWANALNIPFLYKEHQAIIDDDEIDAVVICTPAPLHVPLSIAAAQKGKHVFCEKPISLDLIETKNAIKLINKTGVTFQVGFNRRFDHNFAKIKSTILEGKIGKPEIIKITSRDPSPPPIEYIKQSGGIFLDMSIHDFDMARFLSASDVVEVYASGAVLVDPEIGAHGDIDTALIHLKFENGALGVIDNSRRAAYGYDQRVEVFGSKGCMKADNNTPTNTALTTAEGVQSDKPLYFFLERYAESFIAEIRAFGDAIINNTPSLVTGEDGMAPIVIALAAKKSMMENRPVKLSEII